MKADETTAKHPGYKSNLGIQTEGRLWINHSGSGLKSTSHPAPLGVKQNHYQLSH